MVTKSGLTAPLVSVCIATYNRSNKLNRAVKALIGCSYENLEIIISDNASFDGTQSMCAALTKSDSRIKYFRHAENQGPTKNFEFARAQATGKYFLWLCDDDYFDPDYILTCVDELERDPSLVLASGLGAYYRDGRKLTHYGNVVQPHSIIALLRVIKYLWSAGESSIYYGAYRLDHVRDCRMPNCLGGDWVWVANALLKGKAKMMPMTFIHREYGDSMSSSFRVYASAIGAPSWQGNFPSLAICLNLANHLAFESNEYKNKTAYKKIIVYSLIFGVLLIKFFILNIRIFSSNVPFAKKIYRRFFKRQIVE